MTNLKETSIELIKSLPDDSSVEDIMYEINLVGQVLDGLDDEQKRKTISTAELMQRIEKWQQK